MSKASYLILFHKKPSEKLVNKISDMWRCGKVYETAYVVNEEDTSNMCETIRDCVTKNLGSGNYVFVAKMTGQAAWSGAYANDWLKSHIIECDNRWDSALNTKSLSQEKKETARVEVNVPKITVSETDLDDIMDKVTKDLDNLLNGI